MKLLLKIVVGLLIVVSVTVAIVLWRVDQIAAAAIERGGTYAMGVDTRVDGVDVAILGGRLEVLGLNIANPEGFSDAKLLDAGRLALAVETGTLRSDRVVVPEVRIEGLKIKLERDDDGTYNLQVVSKNLEKLGSGEREPREPKPESGKQYVVEKVVVRDVSGEVELPIGDPLTIEVDEIVLEDVTGDNARGVVLHELMARLFPAIMAGVLDKVDALPGEVGDLLARDLGKAANELGEDAKRLIREVAPGLGEPLDRIIDGAGDRAREAIEGAGDRVREGLEGLLPGGREGGGDE